MTDTPPGAASSWVDLALARLDVVHHTNPKHDNITRVHFEAETNNVTRFFKKAYPLCSVLGRWLLASSKLGWPVVAAAILHAELLLSLST